MASIENLNSVLRQSIANFLDQPFTEVTVIDFEHEEGSSIGENFTSILKRFNVKFSVKGSTDEVRFIGKFPPSQGMSAIWWNEMRLFQRESEFFCKYLPDLQTTLKAICKLPFPKIYLTSESAIIMEDLKESGYAIQDPASCLDLDHMLLVMDKLARFHALGHTFLSILKEDFAIKYPNISVAAQNGIYLTRNDDVIKGVSDIHMGLIDSGISLLRKYLTMEEVSLLERFRENCINLSEKALLGRDSEHFCTIVHGDLWNNNIMFKNGADTKPDDLRFVDLQAARVTRPTYDLANLIYQSTTPELREEHKYDILVEYHKKLCFYLRSLNCNFAYDFETLLRDFNDFTAHGLMMGIINVQTILASDSSVISDSYLPEKSESSESAVVKNVDKEKIIVDRLIRLARECLPKIQSDLL